MTIDKAMQVKDEFEMARRPQKCGIELLRQLLAFNIFRFFNQKPY